MPFEQAELYCQSMRGHLSSIQSRAENEFVFKLNPILKAIRWIGGTRNLSDPDNFYWTDGTELDLIGSDEYANCTNSFDNVCLFMEDEPNNLNGNENCLQQGKKDSRLLVGQWNDGNCNFPRQFSCKRPSKF